MTKLKLPVMLCLIVSTFATALAVTETVDLGPVKLSLDLQSVGAYNVEKDNPSLLNYNSGGNTFSYQYFPATIKTSNTGNRILLEVHQTSTPQSLEASIPQYNNTNNTTGLEHLVEISDMMPSGKDVQRQTYYVDGHKGIALIVNRDQKRPIYLAAFSPDLKDGFGKTVVIIGSDFPLNATKSIFESVKIQLVQSDLMGQSNTGLGIGNTGQSGLGQGNMVQSNVAQSNIGMNNMGLSNMGQNSMGSNVGMSNTMGQGGMMGMMQSCMSMMQSMMGMNNMGSGNVWNQGNAMGQSQSGMTGSGINQNSGNMGQGGMM